VTRLESNELYALALAQNEPKVLRHLCRTDLFFLLAWIFSRPDVNRDWLYDRCREVEADPDSRLDLWSRGHYKSTIITYAKTIQDILVSHGDGAVGREVCCGIFSHTRPISKAFLSQIKRELEENQRLKELFPDVLYENPKKDSPSWSLDGGLIVKRKSNPKEGTVEAHGLVDGQPTSRHFSLRVYDDVVTRESVYTPEMIDKTTAAWELSLNLGSEGGIVRYIGTRYHFNDTWKVIMDRGAAEPRVYPATHNGKLNGTPTLLTAAELKELYDQMGPYTFSAQMMQNPTADSAMGFRETDISYYFNEPLRQGMNVYILVDPAHSKKKGSDYTTVSVIGLNHDNNYYLLDGVRARFNLSERAGALFAMHRKWQPLSTGYERYGLQADIEHINYLQEQNHYRFPIVELGGQMPKEDRIRRLVPIMRGGRFYVPTTLPYLDHEKKQRDFVSDMTEELLGFPVGLHDDIIDGMARIADPDFGAHFPSISVAAPPGLTSSVGPTARSDWEPLA